MVFNIETSGTVLKILNCALGMVLFLQYNDDVKKLVYFQLNLTELGAIFVLLNKKKRNVNTGFEIWKMIR